MKEAGQCAENAKKRWNKLQADNREQQTFCARPPSLLPGVKSQRASIEVWYFTIAAARIPAAISKEGAA